MAWITPKTNWKATDFFNASDYNRIIGNLTHLKSYMDKMYPKAIQHDLGADKTYTDYIYAREVNEIQKAIEDANVYYLDVGTSVEFVGNGNTPTYEDFNRIESATLKLYNSYKSQFDALPRLAFTLGYGKGIKV